MPIVIGRSILSGMSCDARTRPGLRCRRLWHFANRERPCSVEKPSATARRIRKAHLLCSLVYAHHLVGEADAAGEGLVSACGEICIYLCTLTDWRKAYLGDGGGHDGRVGSTSLIPHALSRGTPTHPAQPLLAGVRLAPAWSDRVSPCRSGAAYLLGK